MCTSRSGHINSCFGLWNWVKLAHNFPSSMSLQPGPNVLIYSLFLPKNIFIFPLSVYAKSNLKFMASPAISNFALFYLWNLCCFASDIVVSTEGNFCSRKFLVRFQRLYGFSLSLMKRKANEFCFCFNSEAPFAFFLFDAPQERNPPWKFYYVNCSFIEASLVF